MEQPSNGTTCGVFIFSDFSGNPLLGAMCDSQRSWEYNSGEIKEKDYKGIKFRLFNGGKLIILVAGHSLKAYAVLDALEDLTVSFNLSPYVLHQEIAQLVRKNAKDDVYFVVGGWYENRPFVFDVVVNQPFGLKDFAFIGSGKPHAERVFKKLLHLGASYDIRSDRAIPYCTDADAEKRCKMIVVGASIQDKYTGGDLTVFTSKQQSRPFVRKEFKENVGNESNINHMKIHNPSFKKILMGIWKECDCKSKDD